MSTSHRVLRIAVLLPLLAFIFVTTTRAQIWQGPASLEIRAEGRGASVAGAKVELVYLALEPPAGPPPVSLDSSGRAVVNGLAEGMWRVSVSREGFMTYQAEVDVRRDEKPELAATFQQNVPGAVHMMKVKIARAKPTGPAPLPPPPRIAERPAPRPAEPPAAPAPPAAEPEAQPQPETSPAAPQAPAQPAPQPPPSAPSMPPSTPPSSQPAPAPTPPAEPTPAQPAPSPSAPPQSAAPQPAPPQPAPPQSAPPQSAAPQQPPPPQTAPPPETAPQPAPPAPAAPGGSVLHRSYDDRTCYECKPGEASLSLERMVSAGPGCGGAVRDLLAQSGDPAGGLPEGCAVLRLTLPPGSRYTGYRYEIQERSGSVDCLAGRDCPGGGRWPVDPALVRSAAGTALSAAFENPGSGGDRRAVLTIYYTAGGR